MMTVRQRVVALANFLGLPASRMRAREVSERQFDVLIDAPSGTFRIGYFDGNSFTRENPVKRTLARYGVYTQEGAVKFKPDERSRGHYPEPRGFEPQYDMVVSFDEDGEVRYIHDQRIAMEAGA